MKSILFASFAFVWAPAVSIGATIDSNLFNLETRQQTGCQQLAAKFPGRISYPNSTVYETENEGIFPKSVERERSQEAYFLNNRVLVRVSSAVTTVHLHSRECTRCSRSFDGHRCHQDRIRSPWGGAYANSRSCIHQQWRSLRDGQAHLNPTCAIQWEDSGSDWVRAKMGQRI